MKAGYVKLGSDWYFQGDTPQTGGFLQVTDKDTLKSLKEGRIPYRVEPVTRALTFADQPSLGSGNQQSQQPPSFQNAQTQNLNAGGTEDPASTSLNGGQKDINSMFQSKLMDALNGLTNSKLPGLQARQRQIQTQMLTAPEPDYSKMTPGAGISALNNKGQEYAGALEQATQAIGQEKSFGNDQLQQLTSLLNIAKTLSPEAKDSASIIEYEYAKKQGYTGTLSDWKKDGSSSTGNNQLTDNERALMTVFTNNPIVKNYNEIVSQKNYMLELLSNGVSGPTDMAMIFSFMKSLDPRSVVRETEYDTAAQSGNIFAGWAAKYNGYLNPAGGRLPENVRQEFSSLISQKLKAQTVSYDNYARSMRAMAERQGLNPDNVVPDFSLADVGSNTESTGATIRVRLKSTGQTGSLPVNEFDPSLYEKVSFNQAGNASKSIADAIKTVESNGDYNAKGQSGESGAYQFMPTTWSQWAKEFLGNANAPMTPQNQDTVAISKIDSLLSQGYDEREIALIWNGGTPKAKKGINSKGVSYDSDAYANKVLKILRG